MDFIYKICTKFIQFASKMQTTLAMFAIKYLFVFFLRNCSFREHVFLASPCSLLMIEICFDTESHWSSIIVMPYACAWSRATVVSRLQGVCNFVVLRCLLVWSFVSRLPIITHNNHDNIAAVSLSSSIIRDSRKSRKPWFSSNAVIFSKYRRVCRVFGQNAVFLRFYDIILFLISVSLSLLFDLNTKMF